MPEPTPEELEAALASFEEFRQAVGEEIAQTPERVGELRAEIRELAAPFHAFDVLCAVWMAHGLTRPGALQPVTPGSPSAAEYVAHVLLDRPSPEPEQEPTDEQARRGPDVPRLGQLAAAILIREPTWFVHRQVEAGHPRDAVLELRMRLLAHRLSVRSFVWEWDERRTLQALFAPFEQELRESVGFTAAQALALTEALFEIPMDHLQQQGAEARASMGEMKARVRAARKRAARGAPLAEDADPLVAALLPEPPKLADRWLDRSAILWMTSCLGRWACFGVDELSARAGVEREVAQRFLNCFAVDFGDRADRELWATQPDVAPGSELATMRRRPIVHDGAGGYLPVAVDSVLYGLRDVLIDALKPAGRRWEAFGRHRARLLERRSLTALQEGLDADWAHGGVKFTYLDADGVQQQGEADGILRADGLVVLVETKAGSLSESARRAAPDRLRRALEDLVADAHEQLDRAERALVDGAALSVTGADGEALSLDMEGVMRVLRVVVHLDDLSPVTSAVWQLQETGTLSDDARMAWTVGVHDLETICAMAERPAQLVHYALRRLRTYRQRVWGMDELDFWMRYLQQGLYWEDEEVPPRGVEVANHTDPLDAWAYGRQGLGPARKQPRQKLDRTSRALLDALEATGASGRLEAQLMLLDCDSATRRQIATSLRRLGRRTSTDGREHDQTLVFGEDMAITTTSHDGPLRPGDLEGLSAYGLAKIEQHGLRRWLCMCSRAGSGGRLTAMQVLTSRRRLDEAEALASPTSA